MALGAGCVEHGISNDRQKGTEHDEGPTHFTSVGNVTNSDRERTSQSVRGNRESVWDHRQSNFMVRGYHEGTQTIGLQKRSTPRH